MSAPGDPPIIIQGGGSITITFDERAFPEVASGDFASTALNITRVELVANGGADVLNLDVKNGDATVKVYYG